VVNSGSEWREYGRPIRFCWKVRRGESYFARVGELHVHGRIQPYKGRLIIPAKFRELLGEEFVLTKGLDGCLSIYPMDEWKAFEEKLRALPLTNKNARTFSRFFVAGATMCELDKQGRILVPQTLREFAGLEKDVVLTGNLNRIEVWSREKWSENCNYDDMDSIAESMQDMGIII